MRSASRRWPAVDRLSTTLRDLLLRRPGGLGVRFGAAARAQSEREHGGDGERASHAVQSVAAASIELVHGRLGSAQRGGRRLPSLPPSRRVARAGRAREAGGVPRLGLLGPADAGLRRPGRARADPRARARRARRQPHRPDLHRRPLGRLPVRVAAPGRARQPGRVGRRAATGWSCTARTSSPRCAARRRPTCRRRRSARTARSGSSARSRCCPRSTSSSASAASRGRARCGCAPRSAARRCRGRSRSSATASSPTASRGRCSAAFTPSQQNTFTGKLTPPMMDAVMRQAHDAGLGRVRRYADILRSPYVAMLVARRCSRGCRSASTRWRSSSTCASRRARSRSRASSRARWPPARPSARRCRGGSSTASARAACSSRSRSCTRIGLGAIVAFAELDAPTVVLVLCGFIAGFAIPPTSSVLRSMWSDLLEPRLHQAAYALDSTLIEVVFISGPLLTAAIAAIFSPAGALIVSAIAVVVGNVDLHRAAADEARRARGEARAPLPRRARLARRAHAGADLAADRRRARDPRGRHPGLQPRRGRRGRRGRAAGHLVLRQRRRRPALRHAAAQGGAVPLASAGRVAAAADADPARRSRRRCG